MEITIVSLIMEEMEEIQNGEDLDSFLMV